MIQPRVPQDGAADHAGRPALLFRAGGDRRAAGADRARRRNGRRRRRWCRCSPGDAADDPADPVRAGDQRARPARHGAAHRPDRRGAACRSPSSSASNGASIGPRLGLARRHGACCSPRRSRCRCRRSASAARALAARGRAGPRRLARRWPRGRRRSTALLPRDRRRRAAGDARAVRRRALCGACCSPSRGRSSTRCWRWSGRAGRRRPAGLRRSECSSASPRLPASIWSIRYLTRSPIETMPISALALDHRQMADPAPGHQRQRAHASRVSRVDGDRRRGHDPLDRPVEHRGAVAPAGNR